VNIQLHWHRPFELKDGRKFRLIYDIERHDDIPDGPGIYVFARRFDDMLAPLYIGKAQNLRRRIGQQLESNVRLMQGIVDAPMGKRLVLVGSFEGRPGQSESKALGLIEAAMISTALVEGFELLNIQGTNTLVHEIHSSGNRDARSWLPENTIKVRRS
jgi:hypothetical protein